MEEAIASVAGAGGRRYPVRLPAPITPGKAPTWRCRTAEQQARSI